MNKIFIGGSRQVSRLPAEIKNRLDNVVASGHQVIVGDANGADKAVQKHLLDKHYNNVTIFCSGNRPRNNLGTWLTHQVDVPENAKGFHFYAAKDREMAREADFGLMIWDGKSPGTVLNVLRLAAARKIVVLFDVSTKQAVNIKSVEHWKAFISRCSHELQNSVKERATREEWQTVEIGDQQSLFAPLSETVPATRRHESSDQDAHELSRSSSHDQKIDSLNKALAGGDTTTIKNILGLIARERGMSYVARETGLARESLYRSLDTDGNPEFSTIIKVLSCIGLQLEVKQVDSGSKQ